MGLLSKRDNAAHAVQDENQASHGLVDLDWKSILAGYKSKEGVKNKGPAFGGVGGMFAGETQNIARKTLGLFPGAWDTAVSTADSFRPMYQHMASYFKGLGGEAGLADAKSDFQSQQQAGRNLTQATGQAGIAANEAGIQAQGDYLSRMRAQAAHGMAVDPNMNTAGAQQRLLNQNMINAGSVAQARQVAQNAADLGNLQFNAQDAAAQNQFANSVLPAMMQQRAAGAQGAMGQLGALDTFPTAVTDQIMRSTPKAADPTAIGKASPFMKRVIPKKKTFLGKVLPAVGGALLAGATGGLSAGLTAGIGSGVAGMFGGGAGQAALGGMLGGGGGGGGMFGSMMGGGGGGFLGQLAGTSGQGYGSFGSNMYSMLPGGPKPFWNQGIRNDPFYNQSFGNQYNNQTGW